MTTVRLEIKKERKKITVKLLEKESDGEKKKNVTYKINPKLIKYFCCCRLH